MSKVATGNWTRTSCWQLGAGGSVGVSLVQCLGVIKLLSVRRWRRTACATIDGWTTGGCDVYQNRV